MLGSMKTLTIEVPDAVLQWLDAAARQRRQTVEQTASEALASAAHAEAEPSSAAPTCFDAMRPLWRSVKGPRDLSQREGLGE
jgi:hypothetical protein